MLFKLEAINFRPISIRVRHADHKTCKTAHGAAHSGTIQKNMYINFSYSPKFSVLEIPVKGGGKIVQISLFRD